MYKPENALRPSSYGMSKNTLGGSLAAREAQEVQVAMIVAKQFPRQYDIIERKVLDICSRPAFAEKAIYSYPRGGVQVEGPSIRLAEAIAQVYENIESGVVEVEQLEGKSIVKAFCWDLETNTRDTKTFTVMHVRDTKNGPKKLTSERDIYEMVANKGARRKRSCILAVIPGDITEKALHTCRQTMQNNYNKAVYLEALKDLIDKGVTKDMIEKRFMKKVEAFDIPEAIKIITIRNSVNDGMSSVWDWFERTEPKPKQVTSGNKEKPKPDPKPEDKKVSQADIANMFAKK